MCKEIKNKNSLDQTFKKRHDAFQSISRLFHHAGGRARPPRRAQHVRSQGRQGAAVRKPFAFGVIRERENTCVPPPSLFPLHPIMSPGRRGWTNIWLSCVLTASGTGGRRHGGSRLVVEVSPVFGVALLASDVLPGGDGGGDGLWRRRTHQCGLASLS